MSVNEAFVEMAKMAIKRESSNQILIPDSIGGAQGAIKLNAGSSSRRGDTKVEKNVCQC